MDTRVMMGGQVTVVEMLPALAGGGAERSTPEVAAELVCRGQRLVVVLGGGALVGTLLAQGFQHLCRPLGRKLPVTLRCAGTLRRFLREEAVDVLPARSRVPAWVGWMAWRPACVGTGLVRRTEPHRPSGCHAAWGVSA